MDIHDTVYRKDAKWLQSRCDYLVVEFSEEAPPPDLYGPGQHLWAVIDIQLRLTRRLDLYMKSMCIAIQLRQASNLELYS